VAQATIADQVDDYVLAELLPEAQGQVHGPGNALGIIAVHVEIGMLMDLAISVAKKGRAAVLTCGGETDLVIYDDVDGTPVR
jgi:hypothetical protein